MAPTQRNARDPASCQYASPARIGTVATSTAVWSDMDVPAMSATIPTSGRWASSAQSNSRSRPRSIGAQPHGKIRTDNPYDHRRRPLIVEHSSAARSRLQGGAGRARTVQALSCERSRSSMDFQLSEYQTDLVAATQELARRRFGPTAYTTEDDGVLPREYLTF